MKIGLVGLPLSGKTTVFNLLAGREGDAGGRGGIATIKVPDARLERLSAIYAPQKTTPAEIEFTDLPGFQAGRGGIPSARLGEMRNLDALVHVLRDFELGPGLDSDGPEADAAALEQELILTDLLLVEKRREKLRADIGKGRKELAPELALMDRIAARLEEEQALRTLELTVPERDLLRGYQLVSRLPMILLRNHGEGAAPAPALEALAEAGGLGYLDLDAAAEWEIARLDAEDRAAFLAELGVDEPARDRFIRACYALLDLISFFTVGEDECRAWTITRGEGAQRAAGKIHSDLERGFIRAEVLHCDRFFALGSLAEAKKHGELRLEGKDYVVGDGDILNIRFSV